MILFFCMQINISLQVNALILLGMTRHVQSTQNNRFSMSLQYLKKEVRFEVVCLHLHNNQCFLPVDATILVEMARHVQITG